MEREKIMWSGCPYLETLQSDRESRDDLLWGWKGPDLPEIFWVIDKTKIMSDLVAYSFHITELSALVIGAAISLIS